MEPLMAVHSTNRTHKKRLDVEMKGIKRELQQAQSLLQKEKERCEKQLKELQELDQELENNKDNEKLLKKREKLRYKTFETFLSYERSVCFHPKPTTSRTTLMTQ